MNLYQENCLDQDTSTASSYLVWLRLFQFETVQYEVSARKGRRNILGRPRVKGQSRISPVFSYPLSSNQKYTLNWTALRHATV